MGGCHDRRGRIVIGKTALMIASVGLAASVTSLSAQPPLSLVAPHSDSGPGHNVDQRQIPNTHAATGAVLLETNGQSRPPTGEERPLGVGDDHGVFSDTDSTDSIAGGAGWAAKSDRPGLPSLPPPGSGQPGDAVTNFGGGPVGDSVVLGSRQFGIPVKVDANGSSSPPVEVQLYVSRGGSEKGLKDDGWRMVDRQPPTISEFRFHATSDGLYLFATRTLDATGRPHPSGALKPQLKVFVDTAKPTIELDANADASGRVVATVKATDVTRIQSVQLFYVSDAVRKWRRLGDQAIRVDSRITFQPPEDWQQLSLQAIVTDAAGNQAIKSSLVHRPRIALAPNTNFAASTSKSPSQTQVVAGPTTPPTMQFSVPPLNGFRGGPETIPRGIATPDPSFSAPTSDASAAPGTLENGVGSGIDQRSSGPAGNPAANRPVPVTQSPPIGSQNVGDSRSPDDSSTTKVDPNALAPTGPRTIEQATRPIERSESSPYGAAPENSAQPQSLPSGGQTAVQTQNGYGIEDIPAPAPEREPLAENVPSTGSQPYAGRPSDDRPRGGQDDRTGRPRPGQVQPRDRAFAANRAAQEEFDRASLGDRVPVRFSDSERFSLEYELEAVGSSGVEAIELYGSTDHGKTWKRWGADPDRSSPFDIETNEEGVFCFRIVVVGSNGLSSPRPLSGASPDIAVVVDKTAPETRITGAKYGTGDRAGALVIEYECNDPNLMNRPISLSFSRSMEGPWSTIAAGLRNDGLHAWPADPQLPRQIFLRIDGADQAGNIGTYILEQPIDTQGLAPRARILGFQVR